MTENQTPAKTVTTRHCTCGCGQATSSSKTMYKPGHDARHAGQVARRIVEKHLSGDQAQAELKQLPTANLQHKAGAMVTRLLAKLEAKAVAELAKSQAKPADKKAKKASKKEAGEKADAKATAELVRQEEERHAAEEAAKRAEAEAAIQEEPVWEETYPVKIGRWTYPTRQSTQGVQQRNTKRDGSGEWVAYEG